MASGSSGRTGSGSKAFDFGSDDVLCSYDDLGNQDTSNGKRPDSAMGSNSGREARVSRAGRPLSNIHSQQEESCNLDMISVVEMTMKKYADNILRVLEGLSGRLSQLELYCYNIEQSIGDFKSDLTRDHNEADLKLRSLEKHLQEVHRSIQILRDKQELAETQKELAKLQFESPTKSRSHQTEEIVEQKKPDSIPDSQNQQLALALPRQTTIPTSLPARAPEQHQLPVQQLPLPPSLPPQQAVHFQNQPHAYYSQQNQIPNQPPLPQQLQQDQHLQSELQYAPQRSQMQDLSRQAPPPQVAVNQTSTPSFPQYSQQWPQQFPRQVQPQQPPPQAQVRPQTQPVYPPYPPQPTNPSPESMPMQVPFSGISQPGGIRPESAVYGYGGSGRTGPQQQTHPSAQRQPQNQINQSAFGSQLADAGYPAGGQLLTQPNLQGYMMYDTDGSRHTHPSHFQHGSYPPSHVSALQNPQPPPGGVGVRHSGSQIMRSHPYGELIEKAVNMGYLQEHVVGAIQRMEDSGQPVDFNALLDRLDMHSSGAPRY